jgi:hypothetical protein
MAPEEPAAHATGAAGDYDDAPPPPRLARQDSLQDSYTCPITREVFLNPVTVGCGHNFEKAEVEQAIAATQKCPVCKEHLEAPRGGFKVNIVLRDTIRRLFPDAILSGKTIG